MSLKDFHIFFITIAILTLGGCAAWCFANQTALTVGISCAVVSAILVGYGIWFVRKSRRITA